MQGYQAEDVRVLLRLMDHVLRLTPGLASEARQAMRQVEEEIFIGGISVCIWYEPGSCGGARVGRAARTTGT